MRTPRRWMALCLAGVSIFVGASTLLAQAQDAQQLWIDFNHYVRIARPDLARGAAEALEAVDDDTLLQVVESGDYRDWEKLTLPRALGMETLRDSAQRLATRIQNLRITKMREGERIAADIQRLAEGARPMHNAIERLRAAGQFAAPQLLNTLLDERQAKLHPYVMSAMVQIGEPMVYPLSEALPHLEAVPQSQVARVLAEIGYPRPLPYLKQILERSDVSATVRPVIQAAYDILADAVGVPADATAAELFFEWGEVFYRKGTTGEEIPGLDASTNQGIVWEYSRDAGLVAVPVPGQIYADVLAMRAARQALVLNGKLDSALSLWLSANLRRENRLGDEADPSYREPQEPAFYLKAAGPLRQHDVLATALADSDSALALDAIAALGETAGTNVLLNLSGQEQPLLAALAYPDRRVRWRAAHVLTNARPTEPFPGSFRVVPVLTEALRQTGQKRAVVIGADQDSVNKINAALSNLGYKADGATSLDAVIPLINEGPGVDLIVTNLGAADALALYRNTGTSSKLAFVPIVAVVNKADAIELNRTAGDFPRLVVTESSLDELEPALQAAEAAHAGDAISEDEATEFAMTSLRLLHEVALGVSADVYHIGDATGALIATMSDSRDAIVQEASSVLALLNDEAAQQAIATAALDEGRPLNLRVALLDNLAASARHFGDKLLPQQVEQILAIVKSGEGELALAAAQAHGALTLPTSNVVELIQQ